jgi:hypothetical protein
MTPDTRHAEAWYRGRDERMPRRYAGAAADDLAEDTMRVQDSVITPSGTFTTPTPPGVALQGDWDRVHIDRLELERGSSPSALAKVRVCVALGDLLPVDAEVRLTIEGGPDPSLPDCMTDRMWSAHSYQNGRFDFEAHVPDATVATAHRIRVRVVPTGAVGDPHPPAEYLPTVELELTPSAGASADVARIPVRDARDAIGEPPALGDALGP